MLRFHHYIHPLENHPVKNVTFLGGWAMFVHCTKGGRWVQGGKNIKQSELLEAEAVRKITSFFHDYVHLFNLIAFLKE